MRHRAIQTVTAATVAACVGWTHAPSLASAQSIVVPSPSSYPTIAAPVDETEVEALIARAVERYKAGDYEGAIESFEAAYALDPVPNYLFNIGRVYEDMGKPDLAVDYYERFVAEPEVDPAAREVAQARLDELRPQLEAAAPEPEPEPEPELAPVVEPEQPEPVDRVPDEAASDQPRRLIIAGGALLGVGLATVGAGGGLAGSALSQSRALDGDLDTLEERNDAIDKGETRAAAADGLFIAGGLVAAAGIALLAVGLRRRVTQSAREARVLPSVGPRGASLRFHVRF